MKSNFIISGCKSYGLNYNIIKNYGAMEWKNLVRIYMSKGYPVRAKWAYRGYKLMGGKEPMTKILQYIK